MKKQLSLAAIAILLGSFLAMLLGYLDSLVFFGIAAVLAVFAFKLLPKLK